MKHTFLLFYFGKGKFYDKILKRRIFCLRNIDKSFDNIICLGLILNMLKFFQGYLNLQLFVTKGINVLTM